MFPTFSIESIVLFENLLHYIERHVLPIVENDSLQGTLPTLSKSSRRASRTMTRCSSSPFASSPIGPPRTRPAVSFARLYVPSQVDSSKRLRPRAVRGRTTGTVNLNSERPDQRI